MEKYIYDNSNGLWYELHGDYYLPCLVIPEEEIHTIGIWGRKHQQYLREYRPILYSNLVLSGRLYSYLADIDTQESDRNAAGGEREHHRGVESTGSDGMGQSHEQHPQSCRGDH